MLVLSRKLHETIRLTYLNVDIDVKVVRIGPNSVKIGLEAPDEVSIVRSELLGDSQSMDDGDLAVTVGEAVRGGARQ